MGDNILDKLENKLQTNAVLLAIAVFIVYDSLWNW